MKERTETIGLFTFVLILLALTILSYFVEDNVRMVLASTSIIGGIVIIVHVLITKREKSKQNGEVK